MTILLAWATIWSRAGPVCCTGEGSQEYMCSSGRAMVGEILPVKLSSIDVSSADWGWGFLCMMDSRIGCIRISSFWNNVSGCSASKLQANILSPWLQGPVGCSMDHTHPLPTGHVGCKWGLDLSPAHLCLESWAEVWGKDPDLCRVAGGQENCTLPMKHELCTPGMEQGHPDGRVSANQTSTEQRPYSEPLPALQDACQPSYFQHPTSSF